MINTVKEFFDSEYRDTVRLLENKPSWVTSEKEVVFNSIQRCLGVAQFVQLVGVKYEDLEFYDEFREKMMKLLDK